MKYHFGRKDYNRRLYFSFSSGLFRTARSAQNVRGLFRNCKLEIRRDDGEDRRTFPERVIRVRSRCITARQTQNAIINSSGSA